MMEDVIITKAEFERLTKRDNLLSRLMASGVENSGYFVTAQSMKKAVVPVVQAVVQPKTDPVITIARPGSIIRFTYGRDTIEARVSKMIQADYFASCLKTGVSYVVAHKLVEVLDD